MEPIPAAAVLVFQADTVLLVKQGEDSGHLTGIYGLPCGHIDDDETEEEAAVRELAEETGLTIVEEDLMPYPNNIYTADIPRKDGTTKRYSMTVFLIDDFSGDLKGSSETTPEWIKISDLSKFNLLPNVKQAITDGKKFLE